MKKFTTAFFAVAMLLCFNSIKSQAQALNFGAYSYITLDDIISENQSYTKEAWIKVYTYYTTHGCNILSAWDHPFWLENGVLMAANGYGSTAQATVTDNTAIPTGTWVHVAVTYDAATTTMKLYKNGALIATNTAAPSYIASDLQIGAQEYGDFFDGGDMDEVRLWDVARTQSEIQTSMNCDVPQQSHLVAYYRFNQGTIAGVNTSLLGGVYDYSGNANCGTMMNFNLIGTSANYIAGAIGSCSTITPVLSAPAAITGSSAVCTGSSITLANTTSGGAWLVDDIDTADVVGGVVTGHYKGTVTITYKTCGGSSTKTITVNPSPEIEGTAGTGAITTVVTNGTPSYTYLWSNGATTANVSGLSTGTYTVTVTDSKGCKGSDVNYVASSAVVLTNVISITPSNQTYTGGDKHNIYLGYGPQTATLTANTTGASSFTYSWSPSTRLSNASSKNPTFTPTAAGRYTYTCTATSAGRSVSATVTMCVVDAVDHSRCGNGKILVCHVSSCGHGSSSTKSVKSKDVAKQLSRNSRDHLGACYAGCGSGAKESSNTEAKQTLVIWNELTINAFPNPFNNAINVKVDGNETGFADVTVYDLTGRIVATKNHQGTDAAMIIGENLVNGMYIIEVANGNTTKKIKVVKTN